MGWVIINGQRVYEPDNVQSGLSAPDKPVGIISQANSTPTNYQEEAKGLYKNYLGREGEQSGIDYWANEMSKNNGNVTEAFKVAAKQNYGDTLTNKNSQWNNYSGNVIATDLNGTIAQGVGNPKWQPQFVQKQALKPEVYNNLYAGDLLGEKKYNETFGGGKNILNGQGQLNAGNPFGSTAPNPNIATGSKLFPTLASFNKGVDPYAVYQAAGLKTPVGAYSEGKWSANAGASGDQIVNDTLAEKAGRVKALMAAGLTIEEAQAEAENGFQMPGDAQGPYEGRGGGVGWTTQQVQDAIARGDGKASTYDPSLLGDPNRWNVTPQQTMEGRINALTDPNSPLIAQARANAKMQMNERGLLNSSIASTAADAAAYQAALPIAQADAATEAKAAGYNADQMNQFAVQNAGIINQAGQFNANAKNDYAKLQTSKELAQMDSDSRIHLANLDAQTRTNLAKLDATTRKDLMGTEANYKNLLQTNVSASNIYQEATARIAQIEMSDLNDNAKAQAIYNLKLHLNDSLNVIGGISGLNLGELVTAPTTPSYIEPTFRSKYDDF